LHHYDSRLCGERLHRSQSRAYAKAFRSLIVVLENQSYDSAIRNDLLKSLAQNGAVFSNFGNLYHYSYPNYLAMIAGSDFGTHKPQLLSDNQRTFNDDSEHRTIGDLLNWKNYAEDYPASPTAAKPFLGDRNGRYARKHVPFLSFRSVQKKSFHNVVAVDTHAKDNAFVGDIGSFIADPQAHPLPEYMFYSPNLDDDGHDPTSNPQAGLKKAADWLRAFLTTWLHFDDKTWVPKDDPMKRTLVIVTFDESEGNSKPERIYTGIFGRHGQVTGGHGCLQPLQCFANHRGQLWARPRIRRRHCVGHHRHLEVGHVVGGKIALSLIEPF